MRADLGFQDLGQAPGLAAQLLQLALRVSLLHERIVLVLHRRPQLPSIPVSLSLFQHAQSCISDPGSRNAHIAVCPQQSEQRKQPRHNMQWAKEQAEAAGKTGLQGGAHLVFSRSFLRRSISTAPPLVLAPMLLSCCCSFITSARCSRLHVPIYAHIERHSSTRDSTHNPILNNVQIPQEGGCHYAMIASTCGMATPNTRAAQAS